jgi:hypothetical protein
MPFSTTAPENEPRFEPGVNLGSNPGSTSPLRGVGIETSGGSSWPSHDHGRVMERHQAKGQTTTKGQTTSQQPPANHTCATYAAPIGTFSGRTHPRLIAGLRWAYTASPTTLPRLGARRACTGGFGSGTRRSHGQDCALQLGARGVGVHVRPCSALVARRKVHRTGTVWMQCFVYKMHLPGGTK